MEGFGLAGLWAIFSLAGFWTGGHLGWRTFGLKGNCTPLKTSTSPAAPHPPARRKDIEAASVFPTRGNIDCRGKGRGESTPEVALRASRSRSASVMSMKLEGVGWGA